MANKKQFRGSSISDPFNRIPDVADAPTIGTATDVGTGRAYNNGAANVTITSNADTGGAPTSYSVISTPGSIIGTGTTSPVIVTGLSSATSYTFQAAGVNSNTTGPYSTGATSAITATTVPQAPTVGTVTVTNSTTVSVPFTAGATGGSSITSYTVTSSPSIALSTSGTSTPLTVTGTFVANTAYTFTSTANNANGSSTASTASNSVTPSAGSFTSIATVTAAGGETSLTFSSIPGTYTDLQIRGIARDTTNLVARSIAFTFNGDAGANYAYHTLSGNGTSAAVGSGSSANNIAVLSETAAGATANSFGAFIADVSDYTNTSKYKTVKFIAGTEDNTASGTPAIVLASGLYMSTGAITSITLAAVVGFAAKTTFALYGIKGAA